MCAKIYFRSLRAWAPTFLKILGPLKIWTATSGVIRHWMWRVSYTIHMLRLYSVPILDSNFLIHKNMTQKQIRILEINTCSLYFPIPRIVKFRNVPINSKQTLNKKLIKKYWQIISLRHILNEKKHTDWERLEKL